MAFEKAGDIVKAVSSFHTDITFLKLRTRWENDLDLYTLKPYDAGKGYFSYTSNAPRVLADKVISMLVDSRLLIKEPDELLNEETRNIANNVERFLYGALNLNDERLLRIPAIPPLRTQMAWHAVVRGGFGLKVYVYKNDKGETIPDITVWDLFNMAYAYDDDGMLWAAYTFKIPAAQAKEQYKVKTGTDDVEIISYIDREKYGLIYGNDWLEKRNHSVGYCPVFIVEASHMPPVWQEKQQYLRQYQFESIFAPNRPIYPMINKTVSDMVTLVRRGVKVPLGFWSADGTKTLDEDVWQVEKAAVIPLQTNVDKLEPIMTQTMPADTAPSLNLMLGESQRGGLPHTAMGELEQRLSGYAINQLHAAMATVVTPFAQCIERAYQLSCRSLLDQYGGKDFPAVKVRGRTSKDAPFGYPTADEIAPQDVVGDWHTEVELLPVLPKDDAQRWQFARLAREGEIPLLPDRTIRSDILGYRDPDLLDKVVDQEWADKLLVNRLWDAYVAYLADGNKDKANNVLIELRRLMMATGQAPGGAPGQRQPTAPEQMSMETAGGGIPARETGVPASTLPSEALGGTPGGAANARMRPITEEEI